MLDSQDLKSISEIIDKSIEKNNAKLTGDFDGKLKALSADIDDKFEKNNAKLTGDLTDKLTTSITDSVITAVGEMLEQNILPRLGGLEVRMDKIETRLDKSEGDIAKLPTKEYLDNKLADVASDTVNMLEKRQDAGRAKDRQFKETTVGIFKASNIGAPEQISALEQAIS